MNTKLRLLPGIALVLFATPILRAEEPSPEMTGLAKAAADFVNAYNGKDAAAIAALFTEDGEISDLSGTDLTSGRDEIQARYEETFAAPEAPSIAVEVDSVRLVGSGLAIEDGTVHFTAPDGDGPFRSTTYTAVLQKDESGTWHIASTRNLEDATDAAGELAGIASRLTGDWTCQKEGLRLDLAFGWDESGKFLSGEMLATTSDAIPLLSTIRIGWDAARKTVTWWVFDDGGGFAKGDWIPTDDGWKIRTEGTSADGELISANQQLAFEGNDVILWSAKDRLVDGETIPDNELRIVRQAPEPAAE